MNALHLIRRLPPHVMGLAAMRPTDVWLATFPKAGSSWFRTIIANIISIEEGTGEDVDFRGMDDVMPALGYSNLMRAWPHSRLPRLVKTHQPYRPVLFSVPRRTLYLSRDPRDIMVSFFYMLRSHRKIRFLGTFSEFIQRRDYGLPGFFRHFSSWRDRWTVIARYEALRAQPEAELAKVFSGLGVSLSPETLTEAVRRTSVSRLRKAQDEKGLAQNDLFDPDYKFVRNAKPGEWRDHFSEADLAYYDAFRRQHGYELYS